MGFDSRSKVRSVPDHGKKRFRFRQALVLAALGTWSLSELRAQEEVTAPPGEGDAPVQIGPGGRIVRESPIVTE